MNTKPEFERQSCHPACLGKFFTHTELLFPNFHYVDSNISSFSCFEDLNYNIYKGLKANSVIQ